MKTSALQFAQANAKERLSQLRLPTLKDEDYRFTSLSAVDLSAKDSADIKMPEDFQAYFPDEKSSLEITDRVFTPRVSSLEATAWSDSSDIDYQDILPGSGLDTDLFALASISESFGGLHLVVPEGVQLDLPVHHLKKLTAGQTSRNRIKVELKEGASLRWVGRWTSGSEDSQLFSLQTFILEKNSCLEFLEFEDFEAQARFFIRQEFYLREDSKVKAHWSSRSEAFGQFRIFVEQLGKRSSFHATRSLKLSDRAHSDFWIENRHSAIETRSSFEQWAVLDGQSRSVFNGMIRIPPAKDHSDALHKSRSILLSDRASSENLPRLIIETDDVKVSHGASVSSLNEDQLYYLQSRGLTESEAREMLMEAFLESSWAPLSDENWKAWLREEFGK